MTPKEKQRQLIIEIMKADEESGLYTTRKHTAVQWFASKVMSLNINPKEMHDFLEWFEEAKFLEQEQIREAHFSGSGNNSFEALRIKENDVSDSYENARQYYKQTYEK